MDSNREVNKIPETFSAMRIGVKVSKLHFYLVSTISNVFRRGSSYRAVIRTLIGLDWVLIMSTKTLLIIAWLSSYSFDGGPMGQPIDL